MGTFVCIMIRKKKVLSEKINHLGPTEHLEIFKILKDHGVSFSENKNGVFFNLTSLSKDIYVKIDEFVEYCCDNKKELDEYDLKLQECKYNTHTKSKLLLPNCGVRDPHPKRENTKEMLEVVDKGETIQDFIQKLNVTQDKIASKRVNSKYMVAKKRFMKRISEPVNDAIQDELQQDDDIKM